MMILTSRKPLLIPSFVVAALVVAVLLSHCSVSAAYTGGKPHSSVVKLTKGDFQDALDDPANPIWFLKYVLYCTFCT